ncbi:hypothetical protein A2U01_0033838, partial [Trifolium medium]|nr:hypothetical protein [Trifolium medium]
VSKLLLPPMMHVLQGGVQLASHTASGLTPSFFDNGKVVLITGPHLFKAPELIGVLNWPAKVVSREIKHNRTVIRAISQ